MKTIFPTTYSWDVIFKDVKNIPKNKYEARKGEPKKM
jgi:hypothetical protein